MMFHTILARRLPFEPSTTPCDLTFSSVVAAPEVLDDLITLNLNQSNGRIIEFPLTGVTKVYRIVRKDEHWSLRCALGGLTEVAQLRQEPAARYPNIHHTRCRRRSCAR